jgi:hypothetical protein
VHPGHFGCSPADGCRPPQVEAGVLRVELVEVETPWLTELEATRECREDQDADEHAVNPRRKAPERRS